MDAETVEDKDNDVVEKEMNEDSENKTQEEEKEVIMLNDNNIEETLSQFEEREEGYTLVDETLIKELVESDSEKHEELLSELDEDTLTELYHFISNLDIENSEYKEQLLNTIEIVADKNEFALDINEIEDRFKEDEDTEESSEEVVIEASEDEEEKVGFFKKIFASIGSFFSGLFS
ncbi:hypothetical protein AB3N04_01255 (plasmid) [Alkalihalophilus sp. As8PL]|uniref:Uncharacterized protein n=1 Tax=Alkalihalophilus sp. As8PL TaxID=3237103 RepID=A0AB39BNU8_9BACI